MDLNTVVHQFDAYANDSAPIFEQNRRPLAKGLGECNGFPWSVALSTFFFKFYWIIQFDSQAQSHLCTCEV